MNGKYLYELYSSGQSIQWKNYKGDPLPQWEELQKDRQDGWDDLADTIAGATGDANAFAK